MPFLLDRGAHGLPRLIACAVLLGASIAASSCDEAKSSPTEPTASVKSSVSFGAESSIAIAQPVRNFRCPGVAPFDIPFVVVVNPFFTPGVVVTQIQVQFTDTTGITMPQVTFAAPIPRRDLGSTFGTPPSDMRFPLTLNVGCSIGHNGNMAVKVDTRDGNGRSSSGRVHIDVR